MRLNLEHFLRPLGGRAAVLTITFAKDVSTREAQRRVANFKRRVLRENFGAMVTVREFTQRGRPHFHIAIECLQDIAQGFNWEHYHAMRKWVKAGKHGQRPEGRLNRCPALVRLHDLLNEKAEVYGLGKIIELTPVEKIDAIGYYLGGYLTKDEENKPAEAKGTRSVNYSHRCPRLVRGLWSWGTYQEKGGATLRGESVTVPLGKWANPGAWVFRQKLGKFAHHMSCASIDDLRALCGSSWGYVHREAIYATKLEWYLSFQHAQADGHRFEPEELAVMAINEEIHIQGSGLRAAKYSSEEIKGMVDDLNLRVVGPAAPSGAELEEMRFWDSLHTSRANHECQVCAVDPLAGSDTRRGAADAWTASKGEVIPPEPPRRRVASGGSQVAPHLAVTAEQQRAIQPWREAEAVARWNTAIASRGTIDKASPLRRYILRGGSPGSADEFSAAEAVLSMRTGTPTNLP